MQWRRLIVPALLVGLCACTLLSGAADLVIGSGSNAEPDGAVTAEGGIDPNDAGAVDPPPVCVAPSRCLSAPAGWEGPFALIVAEGGKIGACPDDFVRSWERSGAADAAAPPATCSCACGGISGSCTVTLRLHREDNCSDTPATQVLSVGACRTLANADAYRSTATPVQPKCAPDASTSFAPLDGPAAATGCAPRMPAGCAEGVCVPPTPGGVQLCVRPTADAGDAVCPAGWTKQVSLAAGLEDTRGCSPCTCGAAPTCTFSYTLYNSDDCTTGGMTVTNSNCTSVTGIDSAKLNASALSGTCTPSGGAPVGGVTTRPALSLCCQE